MNVYNYSKKQPDSFYAFRLGRACEDAMREKNCMDRIDRGILLVKYLEQQGFGIVRLEEFK